MAIAISSYRRLYCFLVLAVLAVSRALARPSVIQPDHQPGINITYKETRICETLPLVRSYAGYINVPATGPEQPYDGNIFFWFFESRSSPQTAPLTLWLQGGPGLGSTEQAVSGHNGPCTVLPDSNSTAPNLWSWTGASNMLYLDQPVQTGFSYDEVRPGTANMTSGDIYFPSLSATDTGSPSDLTMRSGHFGSQNATRTPRTTALAASVVVQFLDLWFQEFAQYKRDSINIWSQSYGGHYAPAVASALLAENKKRKDRRNYNTSSSPPSPVGVNSVGVINGLIDVLIQSHLYPVFAINNTYGIQAYNATVAAEVIDALDRPGGCRDQVRRCRQMEEENDPLGRGADLRTTAFCSNASLVCWPPLYQPYYTSGRNVHDIAHRIPDSFPPRYASGFLNNAWVQNELGAKVNYTEPSTMVYNSFFENADFMRGFTKEIGGLLDAGVKVALIHGDRDFLCNWFGGEAVSLAVSYSEATSFAEAGYANISTNATYKGGFVRQRGNFSFSRVFQAGHEVPYYQPETAYRIFERTITGRDVATGRLRAERLYSTRGPSSVAGVGMPAPPQGPSECYVDSAPLTDQCLPTQIAALANGSAVIVDRVVVSPAA